MVKNAVCTSLLLVSLGLCLAAAQRPRLTAGKSQFVLDGDPIQILSGEIHYSRVPPEYWRDRLLKARAMGLNTISTYVFWNFHEAVPGTYDFSGPRDIAAFIRTAAEVGLHVIVRPGPYVCAEWELGGYPAWLLADPTMELRGTGANFTLPAERWLARLGRELAPLMSSLGGPIIAVQVENEYGSFDQDKAYLEWQRDALKRAGLDGALLYTSDGPPQLPAGTLPDLPAVVNFGTGGAEGAFKALESFRPDGPMMTGEYWAGWFDQWGRNHQVTNMSRQAGELEWMLERGYSINIYMFHGGTTFGFMNGANVDNGRYFPQTSSYDYDAALSESGRLTRKYYAFRDAIARHTRVDPPPIPATPAPITVPSIELTPRAPIWNVLGRPVRVQTPRPMESFGQAYGYILYRTTVRQASAGELIVRHLRDYAQVYVDGELAGTMDRRLGQDRVAVSVPAGGRLDILVENSGRVNFNKVLRDERKGITEAVWIGERELTNWDVYTLPMAAADVVRGVAGAPGPSTIASPSFYAGSFNLAQTGDTFLDTRGWGKGTVWINGHHLGRFWDIGPQQTLYVPGPWLRVGRNEIIVFTLSPVATPKMSGRAAPVYELKEAR